MKSFLMRFQTGTLDSPDDTIGNPQKIEKTINLPTNFTLGTETLTEVKKEAADSDREKRLSAIPTE